MEVGKNCAISSGGNQAVMVACMAQGLPPNVTQQCLGNPQACFGPLDPLNITIPVVNGIAQAAGIDTNHIAQEVDKAWGKLNPFN
jgi:hypothetical protein